jgi:predicted PurR-regulated permease PerM
MSERRAMFRGRLRRPGGGGAGGDEVIEIEPGELSGVLAAPKWMRDLGFSSWLLVGVAAAIVGAVWLLELTHTIVMPVITAAIVAAVAGPLVDKLNSHGVPRALGAVIVFLLIAAIAFGVALMVITGIASQAGNLSAKLHDGANQLASWAHDLGAKTSAASDANAHASSSVSGAFKALTHGVVGAVDVLASLAVFLSFAALSLFFLLKDAPTIGRFIERHLGVPVPVAHSMLGRLVRSMRGYFVGVTVVSVWSSAIVGAGALIIGVPLPGTIAVVTFLGGFVPYLGAWTAGAFAVLIALGQSPGDAVALGIVCLLANGILQQLVQPIAFGVALSLHPLVVLIVTIAGGCLFGTIGLILAAPLLSAAVKITADIAAATKREEPDAPPGGELPAAGEQPSPA